MSDSTKTEKDKMKKEFNNEVWREVQESTDELLGEEMKSKEFKTLSEKELKEGGIQPTGKWLKKDIKEFIKIILEKMPAKRTVWARKMREIIKELAGDDLI